MADTPLREIQPASENPWYMLATAGEDHAENTRRWNGYMRHLIGEEEASNLKRADGTPIELPLLSPDEIRQIAMNIPDLPQELPEKISLSGLVFAEVVDFQDFYFPVSVDFSGSRFAEFADFKNSSFAAYTDFRGSTFAGFANFDNSSFAYYVDFENTIFAGTTSFEASTFAKIADFRGSTFAGIANFRKSTFAEYADFENRTFAYYADFRGSRFAGTANFSNAKYEGTTFFQNVTFTVAPLFFETTLHEDTDWTDVDWPDKPADKDAATQYVRRYDRLALIMSTLKQPDNEHQFFRLSMRAKEVRDGLGISTGLSRLYGLFFCYGWGLKRALGLWVLHILLGAGYLWGMALWQMNQPLSGLTALAISFSNSLPFLGLQRGPVESAYACFDTLTGFNITYACSDTLTGFDILWMIQSLSGPLLLFFLLLTIRNRFRLR